MLRRKADRLGQKAYKCRRIPEHLVHAEHAAATKVYKNTLEKTKKQHWLDWLKRAEDPDIWSVHQVTSSAPSDGGKARIPPLQYTTEDGTHTATTNSEKSNLLAKSFFPPKPPEVGQIPADQRPRPCCKPDKINVEQVKRQLARLKPYKAPGLDGIPNIVLSKCADDLAPRLLHIYVAMLERGLQF
jgi:hypothetical protein